jgi:hypothetical protein
MNEKTTRQETPDPARVAALRDLPPEITRQFTKEEIKAFLYDEIWPDSLREKLKDYVVE